MEKASLVMLGVMLMMCGALSAAVVNVTVASPADGINYYPRSCGSTDTSFVFTPAFTAGATSCSLYFGSTSTAAATNASVTNMTATTLLYDADTTTAGTKTWYVSCTDGAVTNSTSYTGYVSFSDYLCYINTTQGTGTTVQYLLKGGVQLATAVVDKSFDSGVGVLEMGAVCILLGTLALGVGAMGRSVRGLKGAAR